MVTSKWSAAVEGTVVTVMASLQDMKSLGGRRGYHRTLEQTCFIYSAAEPISNTSADVCLLVINI